MKRLGVFIYGAGRVGRSLARALEEADAAHSVQVTGAWNRTFARAVASSRMLAAPVSAGDALPEQLPASDVILACVVDDAILDVVSGLARHLTAKQTLLHTSGSLPANIMAVPGMSAHLGSCHPLQSLAEDLGNPGRLRDATFAVEGDDHAIQVATRLAFAVGGKPLRLAPGTKAYYHAAAVVAANYTTVLADAACTLLDAAGVESGTAIDILLPLLEGTLHNLRVMHSTQQDTKRGGDGWESISASLTGPVRRGDAGTIEQHLKAIDRLAKKRPDARDLPQLYRLLTRRAAEVAIRGGLDPGIADQVKRLTDD